MNSPARISTPPTQESTSTTWDSPVSTASGTSHAVAPLTGAGSGTIGASIALSRAVSSPETMQKGAVSAGSPTGARARSSARWTAGHAAAPTTVASVAGQKTPIAAQAAAPTSAPL